MSKSTKTIAFFGASGGCGLSALKHALTDGHTCVALCRKPSKLTSILPQSQYPNLTVIEGNAHNVADVARTIADPTAPDSLVDIIISSIGSTLVPGKLSIEDPNVCRKGAKTLFEALSTSRAEGRTGRPVVVMVSSTGISRVGRDVPLLFVPLYYVLLKVPHEDKKIMEEMLVESDEEWVIVRPSFLLDGETAKKVRVGVEKWGAEWEKKELGYTISREDVGRWMYENIIRDGPGAYSRRAVTITT